MSGPQTALIRLGRPPAATAERLDRAFQTTVAHDADALAALAGGGQTALAMFGHFTLDGPVFDRFPNLKVIANFGVGYDTIDAGEAAQRGILVSHTPDVLNQEVVDTTLMLWLAVSRQLIPSERWARSGDWERQGAFPLTRSIRKRRVGIVGLGRIGLAIAEMAEGFEAEVHYFSRAPKPVPYTYFEDLTAMARASDVLVVITPGGDETRHLINADVIDALGSEGILINVARGSVVDERALVAALQDGRLGGAGLDVFEEEPHIPEALKLLDNVVLLPHVGSATQETRQAMGNLVCDNLLHWQKHGRLLTPVPECQHLNG